jgi:hypothetical protein
MAAFAAITTTNGVGKKVRDPVAVGRAKCRERTYAPQARSSATLTPEIVEVIRLIAGCRSDYGVNT